MSESFAAAPPTVGELRADKTGSAQAWSPRDVLVSLLREIDSGKVDPTTLIVLFREDETGGRYRVASRDLHETLGVIELAKVRLIAESLV